MCIAGYQRNGNSCQQCPKGFYKSSAGNAQCSFKCPSYADSEPGSVSIGGCFCTAEHHAELDEFGNLARCSKCNFYSGLTCPGGYEQDGTHAQPRAVNGSFRTGNTSAVQCHILRPDGSSVCLGSSSSCQDVAVSRQCHGSFFNICAEGSTGHACGECPEGYAREMRLEFCSSCVSHSAAWLAVAIFSDLVRITALNFGMAWIVARGAGEVTLALHSSMIRQFLHWKSACSVLTGFELDRLLPFRWSEKQARAEGLCSGISCGLLRFQWPPEAKAVMDSFFSALDVIPSPSVYLGIACQLESLFPDNPHAKRLVPTLYYLFLPLLSLTCTILLCTILVYIVVPACNKHNVFFNTAARERAWRAVLAERLIAAFREEVTHPGSLALFSLSFLL